MLLPLISVYREYFFRDVKTNSVMGQLILGAFDIEKLGDIKKDEQESYLDAVSQYLKYFPDEKFHPGMTNEELQDKINSLKGKKPTETAQPSFA